MTVIQNIPIEQIRRRADARAINLDSTTVLADSIAEVGLINPIRVRAAGDRFEVIAGSHRLAACDSLDHREIMCIVVADDDLHAELAMIDENLCRAELSPADKAKQTARRKVIYEELHPSTKHGGNLEGAGVAKLATPEAPAFATATARISGQSERVVRRDAQRGQTIIPSVLELVTGTVLDTGVYLDKLGRARAADQMIMAERDLAYARQQERERAGGGLQRRIVPKVADPVLVGEAAYQRFIKLADEIEALSVADIIAGSGRQRSVLGQRASGIADIMSSIMEGLNP